MGSGTRGPRTVATLDQVTFRDSATSGHHPPLHSLPVVSSASTPASLLSPDPGLSHPSPPRAGPRTTAVPPPVVGDGNGQGEPGQVGQQQQVASLLMGLPEQSRAHHQPEEQQQVQHGLGGGRTVRRAALGIALDLSAAPRSRRAKFRALCAPRGSSGQPAPPPRRYLPAPDGRAALPASEAGRPPRPLPCPLLSSGALPGRGVGCQHEDQDTS